MKLLSTLLVLAAAAGTAAPALAQAPADGARQSVGVTIVSDNAKVHVMSRGLAPRVGEDAARIAARMRSVRARGGPSLYVQMQHSGRFEVEIEPDDRGAVYLPLRGQMMIGEVPEDADPRQSIVLFWVLNGQDARYRLSVPRSFRSVVVVVNGREVVNQRLDPATGKRTYTVR